MAFLLTDRLTLSEYTVKFSDSFSSLVCHLFLLSSVIPEKQMREWKDLLLNGLPLYESTEGQKPGFEFCPTLDPIEFKKQEILNNRDYDEYIVSWEHERNVF